MGFKKYLIFFYDRYRYIRYFFKYKNPVGFSNAAWSFFNGFFTKNFILFGLDKNDRSLYISDFQENFKIGRINKYAKVINHKLVFIETIASTVKMPAVKGLVEAGTFVKYGNGSLSSFNELINYIRSGHAVIFKPIEGDGGEGIFLCKYKDQHFYWNQVVVDENVLLSKLSTLNYYFISDVLVQHDYSNKIYPKSVNTIRILTMKDPHSGEPFIAVAAHRIGNDRSQPVDNCAKGGFTSKIDINTGILGKAVQTYFDGDAPVWYSIHPDTGGQVEGIAIPNWEFIKIKAIELARNFSFLEYIGWDIVVLPDGDITVLEANDGADLKLHQVHEPLLKDERIKAFYSFHKAL